MNPLPIGLGTQLNISKPKPPAVSAGGFGFERNFQGVLLVAIQHIFFQSLIFLLADKIVFQKVGNLG